MDQPLPEAIRGAWYLLKEAEAPEGEEPLPKTFQQLDLRIDGGFTRFLIKGGRRKEQEQGDYTFDGNFLILRGRNTDTYRVRPERWWDWSLEDKKERWRLRRALLDPKRDFGRLDPDDARDIRLLPLRVQIEDRFGDDRTSNGLPPAPHTHRLIYRGEDDSSGAPRVVGTPCGQLAAGGPRLWVGLGRSTESLDDKTWQRIVEEVYLLEVLQGPGTIETVEVELLDADDRRFTFQPGG